MKYTDLIDLLIFDIGIRDPKIAGELKKTLLDCIEVYRRAHGDDDETSG